MDATDTHILYRSDGPAMRLHGKRLCAHSSAGHATPAQERYHTVSVYQADAGGYVVHIRYDSKWRDEQAPKFELHELDSLDELAGVLESVNPTAHFVGPPDGARRAHQRRIRLGADLQTRWQQLVQNVLSDPALAQDR
jgi:hypothetical protein